MTRVFFHAFFPPSSSALKAAGRRRQRDEEKNNRATSFERALRFVTQPGDQRERRARVSVSQMASDRHFVPDRALRIVGRRKSRAQRRQREAGIVRTQPPSPAA